MGLSQVSLRRALKVARCLQPGYNHRDRTPACTEARPRDGLAAASQRHGGLNQVLNWRVSLPMQTWHHGPLCGVVLLLFTPLLRPLKSASRWGIGVSRRRADWPAWLCSAAVWAQHKDVSPEFDATWKTDLMVETEEANKSDSSTGISSTPINPRKRWKTLAKRVHSC